MVELLIKHEMKDLFKSKRVVTAVIVFFLLFATILSVRVKDYRTRLDNYLNDVVQAEEVLKTAQNYSYVKIPVIKRPNLASIFNEGFTHDFGSYVQVQAITRILDSDERNTSSNAIFQFTNRLDITFIVTFFLSLFILLISFDAVNYEKENKSLRLLFSFPIKRSQFILKKIVGIMSFVSLVYLIPFITSFLVLCIMFPTECNIAFFQFFIIYGLIALLFLFVVALVGILFSIITTSSNRSLIYALVFWVTFTAIVPALYEYLGKTILDEVEDRLSYQMKKTEISYELSTHLDTLAASRNPRRVGHNNWNGGTNNDLSVYGSKKTFEIHKRYQKYYYENQFPNVKKSEKLNDQIYLNEYAYYINRGKNLFFSPFTQFEYLAESISQTSVQDYIKYINNARVIRDKWTEQGVSEGWLFTKEYHTICDTSSYQPDFSDYFIEYPQDLKKMIKIFNLPRGTTANTLFDEIIALKNVTDQEMQNRAPDVFKSYSIWESDKGMRFDSDGKLENTLDFKLGSYPKYQGEKFTLSSIFKVIAPNLILLVSISLVLLMLIVAKFRNFDIR